MEKVKKEYVRYHGESDILMYFVDGWVYQKLAETHGFWRVIDETGEDYLYSPEEFEVINISDEEFKKEKEKQKKIRKFWNENVKLFRECREIDDNIKSYYDMESLTMLEKKRKVLQALIDGKKPNEIGQDYWDILENKK